MSVFVYPAKFVSTNVFWLVGLVYFAKFADEGNVIHLAAKFGSQARVGELVARRRVEKQNSDSW